MHLQVRLHQNPCTSFTLINHPAENHPALFSRPKPQHGKRQSLSLPWDESHKAQQPTAKSPRHPTSSIPHTSPSLPCSSWTIPVSSTPILPRDVYPHRELPAAFWDLTRLGSARLSSGLQASVFASCPAQTPSPKSETGSFSVDSQMATAFNMDYMGFATITASVGIGSSGRSGQPKQQNLSWLHMRVDIWLPLTLSTGQ